MIKFNHFPSDEEALEIVTVNGLKQLFTQLEEQWKIALADLAKTLYQTSGEKPSEILASKSQASFNNSDQRKILLGICGPGAAGKGTIGERVLKEWNFAKVLNTTTRAKREGEIDKVHYNFVNHETFMKKMNSGEFYASMNRPGRGWYGTEKAEIETKINSSGAGCLFEDNPENVIKVFTAVEDDSLLKTLLYILPPEPILLSTTKRLIYRLSKESDETKRQLTAETFDSTVGQRQIDEFKQLVNLKQATDIKFLVIINDQVNEALALLKQKLNV